MRLKRLELQGFKSFLDRTVLTFDPGITGVVGPNGCGKSNIVDAIQWVMGEQSAKHLRGDSMTDVIFNGSDNRSASSMAEVSLILDKQGVALSPQFAAFDHSDEVAVTRRVYRDGVGEYLLNKVPCRLKDIHELFMDTGVGKRAYSIIEQGQIDRMINVKPEERRSLFEEVAGITKYKSKRKEAEKKLEGTRQNMLRLHDIITELEKQIRSLKVQATRAKNYRELKGELETVDLYLLGKNIFNHKKAIDDSTEKRDLFVNERSQSDAQVGEWDAEITRLDLEKIDQEKKLQEFSVLERNLTLQVHKLESELSLFDERKKFLSETHELAKEEESECDASLRDSSSEVEVEQVELDSIIEQLSKTESIFNDANSNVEQKQRNREEVHHKKRLAEDKKHKLSHHKVAIQNQMEALKLRETDSLEKIQEFESRLSELQTESRAQQEGVTQIEGKINFCAERTLQAENEVSSAHQECQGLSSHLSISEEQVFDTKEKFHTQKSRLESLKELQMNLEGYSPTAREILQRLQGSSIIAKPLAETLQPEPELEDHLEILLGQEMNTLLVQTAADAESLSKLVTDKELERVRILAVEDAILFNEAPILPADVTPIMSKIRVEPEYQNSIHALLGRTYLVSDTEALFRLRKEYPGLSFFSPDSQTLGGADRSVTSGKNPTKTGVFSRKREIETLLIETHSIEKNLIELSQQREVLLSQLQEKEKLHSSLKDGLSSIHIESVEYRKEKEKLQNELLRTERDKASIQNELVRYEAKKQEASSLIDKNERELVVLEEDEKLAQDQLQICEADLQALSSDIESLLEQLNYSKVEKSRLTERRQSLEDKIGRLHSEIEDLNQRKESVTLKRFETEREIEEIDDKKKLMSGEKDQKHQEMEEALVKLADTQSLYSQLSTKLQELNLNKSDLQKQRDVLIAKIQELELKITHEKSNFDQLCSISIERYQKEPTSLDERSEIDIEKLPLFKDQLNLEWALLLPQEKKPLLEEYLKNIKEKITRYGEVNLTAIQEFDEVQKRYDFLMEQKTDLENSIRILEEAILKIDETTKIRFTETFEAVNQKFKEIFPILFNGGKAELTLYLGDGTSDPGVDIMAQPPGKSLRSITLLSGGEKALTAVSLILAIFARKPSPFCLLDEVDAPLDDANVARFNTVVKKMAEKTQFIVITHNKKTMEIAEALYGVTMEKAGVSKMTSVRLN